MLLAVDVGNTNITFGVFDGDEMVTRFHFSVRISRTSDEYGSMICDILERKGFSADSIHLTVVSSNTWDAIRSLWEPGSRPEYG